MTIWQSLAQTKTSHHISIKVSALLLVGLSFSSSGYSANFYDCPENFFDNSAPQYTRQSLEQDSVALCFNGFATQYSGITRTPLWSAEHLTRRRLYQADEIPRDDSFHSEQRLPERMQAQLDDYKGSGYDRGHVAPNADMANETQQYDSFSLANMMPQSPKNNRQVWRSLESVTRYLTKQYGETYVVTGVAFNGEKVVQLNDRVMVPSHVFKALYIPQTGEAGAYYAPNDESERVEVISIKELEHRAGVDVFPTLSDSAKTQLVDLPVKISDIEDRQDYDRSADTQAPTQDDDRPLWLLILIEILNWISTNFLSK